MTREKPGGSNRGAYRSPKTTADPLPITAIPQQWPATTSLVLPTLYPKSEGRGSGLFRYAELCTVTRNLFIQSECIFSSWRHESRDVATAIATSLLRMRAINSHAQPCLPKKTRPGHTRLGLHHSAHAHDDPLPNTAIPQCLATTTSGAVLMPTASQPIIRKNRDSNGVSYDGPERWQYTPSRMNPDMFSSFATSKASWRRSLS